MQSIIISLSVGINLLVIRIYFIFEPNEISWLLINNLLLTYMKSLTSYTARATETKVVNYFENSVKFICYSGYMVEGILTRIGKRDIIIITREPNKPNPPSISEQCNLAINAKCYL